MARPARMRGRIFSLGSPVFVLNFGVVIFCLRMCTVGEDTIVRIGVNTYFILWVVGR